VNCNNYHATPQAPDCPYCVIVALTLALEKIAPNDPALTPAMMLLSRARRAQADDRRAAR
jgi:hypothetical protein